MEPIMTETTPCCREFMRMSPNMVELGNCGHHSALIII